MPQTIKFYSVADEYGEFSNFAAYPIRIENKIWPTTEHYFQAKKFKEKRLQDKIRKSNSPMLAARLGRDRKQPLRRDWESAKINVMRTAIRAKFTQHSCLGEQLLATDNAKIIEHTANDSFWGDGGNGKGKNMPGRILMEIRTELRQNSPSISM